MGDCFCNFQVRKTSQAALLLLLEQEVIERGDFASLLTSFLVFAELMRNTLIMICFVDSVDVERQICPVLIELCSIDSTDDFRTEAVTVSIPEEKCSSCLISYFPYLPPSTNFTPLN